MILKTCKNLPQVSDVAHGSLVYLYLYLYPGSSEGKKNTSIYDVSKFIYEFLASH